MAGGTSSAIAASSSPGQFILRKTDSMHDSTNHSDLLEGAPDSNSAKKLNSVSHAQSGRRGSGVRRVQQVYPGDLQSPITLNKEHETGSLWKTHSMELIHTFSDGPIGRSSSLDTVSPAQSGRGVSGAWRVQQLYPGHEHGPITQNLGSGICTTPPPFLSEITSLNVSRKAIANEKITFYRQMTLKFKGLLASGLRKLHTVREDTKPKSNHLILLKKLLIGRIKKGSY